MPPAVIPRERVKLVDDEHVHITQQVMRVDQPGDEDRLERFWCRKQDVRRLCNKTLPQRLSDVPVPQADPVALARMQKEREAERTRPGLFRRSFGLLRTAPDVSTAARTGQPTLTPPSETASATEALTPTSAKPTVGAGRGTSGNGVVVATVAPGSPGSSGAGSAPATSAPSANSSGAAPPPESSNTPAPAPGTSAAPNADPSAVTAKPDEGQGSDKGKKADKKKESTSKKKKGLRKIIPW